MIAPRALIAGGAILLASTGVGIALGLRTDPSPVVQPVEPGPILVRCAPSNL